jgi:hypothetical protein
MSLQKMRPPRRAGFSFDHGKNLAAINRLYAFHHSRRFEWLRRKIAAAGKRYVSILELGCNDATSLDYVPVPVRSYLGFDAGWRSGWRNGTAFGLEAARQRYALVQNVEFRYSGHYMDLASVTEKFDFGLVLETFEYLETPQLEFYISALSEKVRDDGYILSTMPNEKGIPLLVKHFGSRLSGVQRSQYTLPELANAFLGRMNHVPRAERGRKGFDYQRIADLIRLHFRYVRLEPVGISFLPCALSPNIGLVASRCPLPSELSPAAPPAIFACEV